MDSNAHFQLVMYNDYKHNILYAYLFSIVNDLIKEQGRIDDKRDYIFVTIRKLINWKLLKPHIIINDQIDKKLNADTDKNI